MGIARLAVLVNGTGPEVASAGTRTVVTTGVEIANETFEGTADPALAVDHSAKRSPGLEFDVVFLGVTALALATRRHR